MLSCFIFIIFNHDGTDGSDGQAKAPLDAEETKKLERLIMGDVNVENPYSPYKVVPPLGEGVLMGL